MGSGIAWCSFPASAAAAGAPRGCAPVLALGLQLRRGHVCAGVCTARNAWRRRRQARALSRRVTRRRRAAARGTTGLGARCAGLSARCASSAGQRAVRLASVCLFADPLVPCCDAACPPRARPWRRPAAAAAAVAVAFPALACLPAPVEAARLSTALGCDGVAAVIPAAPVAVVLAVAAGCRGSAGTVRRRPAACHVRWLLAAHWEGLIRGLAWDVALERVPRQAKCLARH
eukprot:364308-Chlamydomonas_euryale.AAC.3